MRHCIFIIIGVVMLSAVTVHSGQPLTFVRGQDFAPYHFITRDGKLAGFIIDTIREVAHTLDLDIRFEQYPWSRCLRLVEAGRVDAMINLFQTPKRRTFMYFANNIIAYEVNRFFKPGASPVSFSGRFADLADLRIGAIRNYSYGQAFDRADLPNVLRHETEKTLILGLINQRCDIIIGNEIVLRTLARQISPEAGIVAIGPRVTNDPLYIGFSKARNHKALSERFFQGPEPIQGHPPIPRDPHGLRP